jgi:hypothetical protein
MFTLLSETKEVIAKNVRPANETLNELLSGLGFDAEHQGTDLDLAIDRFDQWTNPRGTVLATITTGMFLDTDVELERVA